MKLFSYLDYDNRILMNDLQNRSHLDDVFYFDYMYSEFLFDAEDNHIADSVVLVFSIKNSTDVLLFDCCLEFRI